MAKRKVIRSRANLYWDGGKFFNNFIGNPDDKGKITTGLFKGMSGTMGNFMSGVGSAVGKIGGGLIAGDLESGAGNAIGSIGSTIGSVIPGPMGGLVSAASGLVGGLVNRAFGSKLNKENIAKAENNISQLSSFTSDASSFDQLAANFSSAPVASVFSKKDIGKDGWFSNKAKKKYNALKKQQETAQQWVDNSLANNAENIEDTMAQNLEANYSAFGGPLGGVAIGYELAKQDLANKHLSALSKNKFTSMPNSFGPISTFAYGGQTHGSDFTNGLTYIEAGGTHESNPYEGVPFGVDQEGTPNLVEEGEVVWNDYVFSNRIPVPQAVRSKYKLRKKKDMTYADAAEYLAKESEERPNDPISQAGLKAALGNLASSQEEDREKVGGNKYAKGGYKSTMFRYAPVIGQGIASITDALGWTNKPDYSDADALLEATRGLGTYKPVAFSPVGNMMTFTPMDKEFYTNKLRSQAAAGRRAIANTSGGNRASAVAGILASDMNTLTQFGDFTRKAEEYNQAQRQKVEEFNRATNMYNSEGSMKAASANQSADASAKGRTMSGLSSAYTMRNAARVAADQAKSSNISGFLQSLGDIGYENANHNFRTWAVENGVFGPLTDEQKEAYSSIISRAKGGKVTRVRRGLTL